MRSGSGALSTRGTNLVSMSIDSRLVLSPTLAIDLNNSEPVCIDSRLSSTESIYQILFSSFSIAPAHDNGRLADGRLFLIGG